MLILVTSMMLGQDSYKDETYDKNHNSVFVHLNDKFVVSPTGINTKLSEVGSAFFMQKYIIYSSRKTGAIGAGRDENTKTPYNSLYCVNVDDFGNLSRPYFFAMALDENGNEGGLTFTPDEKIVYYTNSVKSNTTNYQLYKASFDSSVKGSNVWKKEGQTEFNSENYSIENPNVSPDGKKIYFSSNMPGGFGGYDLYSADLDMFGNLKNLKNLGKKVNTVADEKFPYVSPENNLYFSSNGHDGYGGQDIFVSKINKRSYTTPVNLGNTMNTKADEVAFVLGTKDWGFISSNRAESLGLYDIYKFSFTKLNHQLKGTAIEKNSKIALPNAKVDLINEDGDLVATKITDDKGNFTFDVVPQAEYTVVADKEGYETFKEPVVTSVGTKVAKIEMDLKPAVVTETNIIVEKIYFDFNKASIKKESTLALDKIYDVLITYPEMKISINAHTDTRGKDTYNQVLSEKRAFSAMQYLAKKGIAKERIEYKGYGESQPLSTCGSNCTPAEYDVDRRVEFVIIK